MRVDFDKKLDRKGTDSIKWEGGVKSRHENPLPMWIADMDLPTPEFVLEGMRERMKHPVFGYFFLGDRFYDSIIGWHRDRYGVTEGLKTEHIQYQNSVLGSIATAIEVTTEKNDAILVQTPGYAKFKEIIGEHQRTLIDNPLRFDGERYVIDYEDMEEKLKSHRVRAAVFCSPHNPTGRVWEREELARYVELCRKYDVTVIADEIWADFTFGRPHTPLYTVAGDWRDRVISFYSPTKTFNLAGLVISYAVIFDRELSGRFEQWAQATHYNNCNTLSVQALISAYGRQGGEWVDCLNAYIQGNTDYICDFVHAVMPKVRVARTEGTYLSWLDFSRTGLPPEEVVNRCVHKAGVILNDGRTCIGNGDCCMRMNAAASRSTVEEAMARIELAFSGSR